MRSTITPLDTWVLSIPGIRNIKVRCKFGGEGKAGKFGVYTFRYFFGLWEIWMKIKSPLSCIYLQPKTRIRTEHLRLRMIN